MPENLVSRDWLSRPVMRQSDRTDSARSITSGTNVDVVCWTGKYQRNIYKVKLQRELEKKTDKKKGMIAREAHARKIEVDVKNPARGHKVEKHCHPIRKGKAYDVLSYKATKRKRYNDGTKILGKRNISLIVPCINIFVNSAFFRHLFHRYDIPRRFKVLEHSK